ncbi:hypothetical protein F2P81_017649 [Scophthalmus maximus]|uniref:Uncharacterized protein n=1 Tax=Scophthalmus maximus TaxID=52904 RepID=A0A6A4SFB8_SCOMX|nr:hypothetical protein F2P81_017649 [Scophthalmus maximus]
MIERTRGEKDEVTDEERVLRAAAVRGSIPERTSFSASERKTTRKRRRQLVVEDEVIVNGDVENQMCKTRFINHFNSQQSLLQEVTV